MKHVLASRLARRPALRPALRPPLRPAARLARHPARRLAARFAALGLAVLLTLAAGPAAADCFADYKAKRDKPLKLHYGVIALPEAVCTDPVAARAEIAARIGAEGWKLLTVVSTFDRTGLEDGKRKENAGEFYLRY